jgi:hypothetical protein
VEACTALIWLRIGKVRGRLWVRQWTFGLYKMRKISWLGKELSAFQEGLCCM